VPPYRVTGPAATGRAEVRTYLLDRANDLPHDIAIDSGGRVVVTGMMSHQMLTLDTSSGRWTAVPIPVPAANPRALDVDAAGRWWVALGRPRMVARHDPRSGEWLVAEAGVYAHSVALAPDGGAWLNGHFSKDPAVIARVDTVRRAVETLALPNHPTLSTDPGGPIPYELRVGRDGVVWTSELQGNRLVGYDPARRMSTVIDMPEPDMGPRRFDIDSSGALWVPAYAANELVRVEPRATGPARIDRFPLPIPNLLPYVVRMDPRRGGLWLGTGAGDVVLHFAPATRTFTKYALPDTGAIIRHLTVAPRSGDVWLAYGSAR
jgi:streptogramin lyase